MTSTICLPLSRYGNLVLAVEVISSTATIGYAVLLIKQSKPRPSLGLPVADPNEPLHPDDVTFNLRVLIPCYKEKVGALCAFSGCKPCVRTGMPLSAKVSL